jgi:hypothetical protein
MTKRQKVVTKCENGEVGRSKPLRINGRGDRIRTCDIYVPNVIYAPFSTP